MSYSKRIDEARIAFARKDVKASQPAHDPDRISQAVVVAQEKHGGASSLYLGKERPFMPKKIQGSSGLSGKTR